MASTWPLHGLYMASAWPHLVEILFEKNFDEYTNYLKPIISFRFSPNGNKNISDKDISLNYDSVFSLNRIGTSYQVEGGEALSLGLEF